MKNSSLKNSTWTEATQEDLSKAFHIANPEFKKTRLPAFERATLHKGGHARKTRHTVEIGEKETLHIFAESGVHFFDFHLLPESELNFSYIQNLAATESSMTIVQLTLEKGARACTRAIEFGGDSGGFLLQTNLVGEGSSVHEQTVYFGDKKQNFDMFSETVISAPRAEAVIESRGILTGHATARFDGNIHIERGARGASARLLEHTLLLSENARMNAIPGLKIDTNEVMATHSASVTRVDDEQLFYAGARGIEPETAVRLIAEGFLKSLYGSFPQAEKIDSLMQEKLCRGASAGERFSL